MMKPSFGIRWLGRRSADFLVRRRPVFRSCVCGPGGPHYFNSQRIRDRRPHNALANRRRGSRFSLQLIGLAAQTLGESGAIGFASPERAEIARGFAGNLLFSIPNDLRKQFANFTSGKIALFNEVSQPQQQLRSVKQFASVARYHMLARLVEKL